MGVTMRKLTYFTVALCLAALSLACAVELVQPGALAQNLCNEYAPWLRPRGASLRVRLRLPANAAPRFSSFRSREPSVTRQAGDSARRVTTRETWPRTSRRQRPVPGQTASRSRGRNCRSVTTRASPARTSSSSALIARAWTSAARRRSPCAGHPVTHAATEVARLRSHRAERSVGTTDPLMDSMQGAAVETTYVLAVAGPAAFKRTCPRSAPRNALFGIPAHGSALPCGPGRRDTGRLGRPRTQGPWLGNVPYRAG